MEQDNNTIERKQYGEFLADIINYKDKYKRISDNQSMVIAIDSSWGTGKTTFIDSWIKDDKMTSNDRTIIKYSAWENDFFEDPFESFVYTIANSEVFKKHLDKTGGKEDLKNTFIEFASKIGKAIIKKQLSKVIGEELAEESGEIFNKCVLNTEKYKNGVKQTDNIYSQFEEYKNNIQKFKNILNQFSENNLIIIVIDELDRCKPIFAIRLLEIVKHIFDCKNIVFVFAIDMEQLSYSVKKVYGQEMDATGYLCRFFDYVSKMPPIDKNVFISYLMNKNKLVRENLFNFSDKSNINSIDMFIYYSKKFDLSLRDIETIYNNFMIIEDRLLNETDCASAYALYMCLLMVKYKHVEQYNKIFFNYSYQINYQDDIGKMFNSDKYIKPDLIDLLNNDNAICKIKYNINNKSNALNNAIINTVEEHKIIASPIIANEVFRYNKKEINIDESFSLSNILFKFDIKNWNSIKNKSLKQYIQERMEIFDLTLEKKD